MLISKYIVCLSVLSVSALVQAAEVKITSFNFIGYRSSAAELCGIVEGDLGSNSIIDVVSDPTYKTPGHYSAILNKDGKFCILINTVTGKADANLRDQSEKATAVIR